jgi:hypothetical protein
MEEKYEKLGELIDSIDNITHTLNLPMPDKFHVEKLRSLLPEKVKELKECFIEITGENPWQ